MKYLTIPLVLLATLLVFLQGYAQNGNIQWRTLPNAPVSAGARPEDVFFVNPLTGWIVNLDGKIHKTTDGGQHWLEQLDSQATFGFPVLFR